MPLKRGSMIASLRRGIDWITGAETRATTDQKRRALAEEKLAFDARVADLVAQANRASKSICKPAHTHRRADD